MILVFIVYKSFFNGSTSKQINQFIYNPNDDDGPNDVAHNNYTNIGRKTIGKERLRIFMKWANLKSQEKSYIYVEYIRLKIAQSHPKWDVYALLCSAYILVMYTKRGRLNPS